MNQCFKILLGLLAMCSFVPTASAQFDHLPDGEGYPALVNSATVSYGSGAKRKLNISRGKGKQAPLVVIVGTWDWSTSAGFDSILLWNSLASRGFAVAEVFGERASKVGRDAVLADIGLAIQYLRNNAANRKIDPERIVLIGIGTGAAFVSLFGTDPTIAATAGIPFQAIKSVVLLDGEGMDAKTMMEDASGARKIQLEWVFGKTSVEQVASSAIGHVLSPNVPDFYVVAFAGSTTRAEIAGEFAMKLRQAGTNAVFDSVGQPYKYSRDSNSFGSMANSKSKALIEHIENSLK